MYTDGKYQQSHPTWNVEDSPWKADYIWEMIKKNSVVVDTIGEVGCGAGEILVRLQKHMDPHCSFVGYEISPQAYQLCMPKANPRLHFYLQDFVQKADVYMDLLLVIDVLEHVPDYASFLRGIKEKAEYKVFHIPLELFALAILKPDFLPNQRRCSGHLHFFTKEIALQTLKEFNYEIIDCFYTPGYLLSWRKNWKNSLLYAPRRVIFPLNNDMAVRLFGGYSLLVLTR